jgi:hypothetical protein
LVHPAGWKIGVLHFALVSLPFPSKRKYDELAHAECCAGLFPKINLVEQDGLLGFSWVDMLVKILFMHCVGIMRKSQLDKFEYALMAVST